MKVYVSDLDSDQITILDYNKQELTYSISNELAVDETNYQQEYLKQPAKYAFWSAVLQSAKLNLAAKTHELENVHAALYQGINKQLQDAKVRPTKDLIESYIVLQDSYKKALKQVDICEYSVGQVTYLVKAFEQRKDMLISYGSEMRRDKNYGN